MEDEIICSPSASLAEQDLLDLTLDNNFSSEFSNSASLESNMSEALTNYSGNIMSSSARRIPAAIMIPTGIMLYVLSLLTFVGNAMVLHAIRTDKRLQTVSNMFIMSLAIADLTVGVIVMPISAAYAITGDWKFGRYVCLFWLSVDYTASTASIFNLSILSLDRYWSITSPLRYLRRRTKKRALIMIMMAWIGASMWFIPVLGWNTILRKGPSQLPDNVCETAFATNMPFKVVTSILNFYIPTVIITFLYVRIYMAIKQRSKDIVKFGAYTASGVTSMSAKKSVRRHQQQPTTPSPALSNNNKDHAQERVNKARNSINEKKIEFHRLAVVALPLEKKDQGKARIIQEHAKVYQNGGSKSQETAKLNHIKKPLSCEALSVFDGITVKVQYIGDDESACNSTGMNSNGIINSSKELLLGLEERKKAAAEVTTVPLRQPLCANYKTIVTSTANSRQNSFTDHFHHHRSSVCHSGHLQCYRSKKVSSHLHPQKRAMNELSVGTNSSMKGNITSNGDVTTTANASTTNNAATSVVSTDQSRFATGGARKANPNAVLAKEKKAAKQLGVIVGAFIICFLPYFTLFMVVAYCGHDQCVNPTVFTITIWFGYFNSTLNPILYPLCNANFKTAFKRMLRLENPDQQQPLQGKNNDLHPAAPKATAIVSKNNGAGMKAAASVFSNGNAINHHASMVKSHNNALHRRKTLAP